MPSLQKRQTPQVYPSQGIPTLSPIRCVVTLLPTRSTRPTISWPGITGYLMAGSSASTTCRSVRQTPQALTRMRICPSPGRGSARSCSCKGAPGIESTIARIHASPGERVGAEYQEYIYQAGRPILTSVKVKFRRQGQITGSRKARLGVALFHLDEDQQGLACKRLSLSSRRAHMAIKDILLPLVGEPSAAAIVAIEKST